MGLAFGSESGDPPQSELGGRLFRGGRAPLHRHSVFWRIFRRRLAERHTDEADLLFYHSLILGEGDFHALKAEQRLRVDFQHFPMQVAELLRRCFAPPAGAAEPGGAQHGAGGADGGLKMLACLDCGESGESVFSIVEANQFRELTHIALRLRLERSGGLGRATSLRVAAKTMATPCTLWFAGCAIVSAMMAEPSRAIGPVTSGAATLIDLVRSDRRNEIRIRRLTCSTVSEAPPTDPALALDILMRLAMRSPGRPSTGCLLRGCVGGNASALALRSLPPELSGSSGCAARLEARSSHQHSSVSSHRSCEVTAHGDAAIGQLRPSTMFSRSGLRVRPPPPHCTRLLHIDASCLVGF